MSQEKMNKESEVAPEKEYVNFGDICHKKLGITTQVGSFYLHGIGGYPNLGEGLRFTEKYTNIHAIKIDKNDAEIFIQRVEKFREEQKRL